MKSNKSECNATWIIHSLSERKKKVSLEYGFKDLVLILRFSDWGFLSHCVGLSHFNRVYFVTMTYTLLYCTCQILY